MDIKEHKRIFVEMDIFYVLIVYLSKLIDVYIEKNGFYQK